MLNVLRCEPKKLILCMGFFQALLGYQQLPAGVQEGTRRGDQDLGLADDDDDRTRAAIPTHEQCESQKLAAIRSKESACASRSLLLGLCSSCTAHKSRFSLHELQVRWIGGLVD